MQTNTEGKIRSSWIELTSKEKIEKVIKYQIGIKTWQPAINLIENYYELILVILLHLSFAGWLAANGTNANGKKNRYSPTIVPNWIRNNLKYRMVCAHFYFFYFFFSSFVFVFIKCFRLPQPLKTIQTDCMQVERTVNNNSEFVVNILRRR